MKTNPLCCLTAFAPVLLIAFAASFAGAAQVTFRFQPPPGTIAVSVAGSFNAWNIKASPMADPDDDGIWEVAMNLPPGSHHYKFVVNGSQWLTNESATEFTDDGFGGRNSVLTVGSEPITVLGTNPATGSVATSARGETPVRFRIRPTGGARTVSVAGTFNDWSSVATPLADADGDGVWETTIRIAQGTHQYKFVVDGTEWLADEHAAEFTDDGLGGRNSILHVGKEALVVGEPGGTAPGSTTSGTGVTFRYKPAGLHANSVSVAGSFNEWNAAANPMRDEDGDGVWELTLRLTPGRYTYEFVVNGIEWFTDTTAGDFEDDGFGGRRAAVIVGNQPIGVGAP